MNRTTRIVSAGASFPTGRLTNEQLSRRFDKPAEFFFEKTGIVERAIAAEGESTHSFSVKAATEAFERAGLSPDDIDLVIVGTVTPTYIMPSEACLIQKSLGIRNATAFDVSATCSGWLYALSIADTMIRAGRAHRALVMGADTLSKLTNPEDRNTSMLFGDGAGATILEAAPENSESGIIDITHRSYGEHGDLFIVPAGGSAQPLHAGNVASPERYMNMKGMEVFRHSVYSMTEACRVVMSRNNVTAEQIEMFLPHQANINIAYGVADKLGIPQDRIINNISHHGNVSAACLPTAVHKALYEHQAKKGSLALLCGFGAGFNSGAALLRW